MKKSPREVLEIFIELIKQGEIIIGEKGRLYKLDKEGRRYPAEYLNNSGYYQARLYNKNQKYFYCLSHRIIYAFYYGLERLNDDLTIHHVDYDKTNNDISNLIQISGYENSLLNNGDFINKKEQFASVKSLPGKYHLKSRLNKLIKERGYYKDTIAKVAGVNVRQINNYEVGNCYIPMDKAYKIADFFGVKVDDLYERIES